MTSVSLRGNRFRCRAVGPDGTRRSRSFASKNEALMWGLAVEGGALVAASEVSVGQLIDRYIALELPHKKSAAETQPRLLWWKGIMGHAPLASVDKPLIIEATRCLEDVTTKADNPISGPTKNRYIAAISHAFTRAVHWGYIGHNPFHGLPKFKENRGRLRYLSEDELKALLKASAESYYPHLHLIVLLALTTGARRGEILGLTPNDIDLDNQLIFFRDTKNGETRVLPIVEEVEEMLRTRVRESSGLLFPGDVATKPKNIRKAWLGSLAKAKIKDFRFHDLRHTCASYLAMSGASDREIAEVLGHKTQAMARRYSHLSPNHVRGVVEKLRERIK